ncbi:MAG: hypothetical protein AB7O97_21800 [Planctomycetota bacterium]
MAPASVLLGYVGPGGMLSAIGAFVALVLALVLAVVGFVWYPIQRLLRALRRRPPAAGRPPSTGRGREP